MKKFLAILMAATMVVCSLSGCGAGSSSSSAPSSAAVSSQSSAFTADEKETISHMSTTSDNFAKYYNDIADGNKSSMLDTMIAFQKWGNSEADYYLQKSKSLDNADLKKDCAAISVELSENTISLGDQVKAIAGTASCDFSAEVDKMVARMKDITDLSLKYNKELSK